MTGSKASMMIRDPLEDDYGIRFPRREAEKGPLDPNRSNPALQNADTEWNMP